MGAVTRRGPTEAVQAHSISRFVSNCSCSHLDLETMRKKKKKKYKIRWDTARILIGLKKINIFPLIFHKVLMGHFHSGIKNVHVHWNYK